MLTKELVKFFPNKFVEDGTKIGENDLVRDIRRLHDNIISWIRKVSLKHKAKYEFIVKIENYTYLM